jgi:hypothetical protein
LPRLGWAAAPAAAAAGLAELLIVVTQGGAPPFTVPGETESALAAHARSERTGATRVLLVGDSVADSLAVGLFAQEGTHGFVLQNQAAHGCGMRQGEILTGGGFLPRDDCASVPELWQQEVDQFRPEVVVLLISAWDGFTYFKDGRSVPASSSEAEEEFTAGLERAFDILSSRGARLVLLTTPYIVHPTLDDGAIDRLNELGAQAAERSSADVTVIDLNEHLSPDGTYTPDLDGVRVRSNDDLHFSEEGAVVVSAWLAPRILDEARLRAGPPLP